MSKSAGKKHMNGGHKGGSEDQEAPGGKTPPPKGAEDVERPDEDADDEPDDFNKSLDAAVSTLQDAVRTTNPKGSRKQDLLKKSVADGLSDDEETELAGLLTSGKGSLRSEVTETVQTDDLAKSMDGSAYLESLASGLGEGMGLLADRLEKSMEGSAKYNAAAADVLIELAGGLQSLKGDLEELKKSVRAGNAAPSRQPRSTQGAPVARTFAGNQREGAGGDRMGQRALQDGLTKSLQKGVRSLGGRSIAQFWTAHVDGGGEVPPEVEAELKSVLKAG